MKINFLKIKCTKIIFMLQLFRAKPGNPASNGNNYKVSTTVTNNNSEAILAVQMHVARCGYI